ncbi:type II toxin-antitoxin system ParD family antitoxin [uncultured Roseobacter sp.]|uniref:ribbon-helix-helix domain-containing protein n=1 Tax=uncultured Roseobacter sp. TaxID=114847 RepID=UPI002630C33F|nr:type II toxin-antitoxin system ParD family antitoxin [uncultured Roseobacter sp.]
MSVKASISLTETQDSFARDLVGQGRYPSLSAVLQQGLELLREQTEAKDLETEALRTLIQERRAGPFVDMNDSRARTRAMLAGKKSRHGL